METTMETMDGRCGRMPTVMEAKEILRVSRSYAAEVLVKLYGPADNKGRRG